MTNVYQRALATSKDIGSRGGYWVSPQEVEMRGDATHVSRMDLQDLQIGYVKLDHCVLLKMHT